MKYDQITEAKKNREDKLEVVKLPYKLGDLSPVLSKNNVDYHYNVLTKAYVRRYNEGEGDPDNGIAPGTRFELLPDTWACPVCGAEKMRFEN